MSTESLLKLDEHNTFCISLDNAFERWTRMCHRFDTFQMNITLWPASKPENVVDKCVEYLSPGQRACAQSHMKIWRYIVNKKLPYALVLEDDACFDKKWRDRLHDFFGSSRKPWDMLLLNCSEPMEPAYTWVSVQDQYLTGAYLISLNGARKLVDMFGDKLFAADWMTTRLQLRGRCYASYPWLVIQEGIDSTIGSGVLADHAKVLRCLQICDYAMDNYV